MAIMSGQYNIIPNAEMLKKSMNKEKRITKYLMMVYDSNGI